MPTPINFGTPEDPCVVDLDEVPIVATVIKSAKPGESVVHLTGKAARHRTLTGADADRVIAELERIDRASRGRA